VRQTCGMRPEAGQVPPEPVGGLLRLHGTTRGIQLRVPGNLWGFRDVVTASTLGFGGIRLRYARPRPNVPGR
jgi:hypothetical protein